MKKYLATCKHTGNRVTVTAGDIKGAAVEAAKKLNKGRGGQLGVYRQTGTYPMGGCFQAYTGGNTQEAVGYLFHVTEI